MLLALPTPIVGMFRVEGLRLRLPPGLEHAFESVVGPGLHPKIPKQVRLRALSLGFAGP